MATRFLCKRWRLFFRLFAVATLFFVVQKLTSSPDVDAPSFPLWALFPRSHTFVPEEEHQGGVLPPRNHLRSTPRPPPPVDCSNKNLQDDKLPWYARNHTYKRQQLPMVAAKWLEVSGLPLRRHEVV